MIPPRVEECEKVLLALADAPDSGMSIEEIRVVASLSRAIVATRILDLRNQVHMQKIRVAGKSTITYRLKRAGD